MLVVAPFSAIPGWQDELDAEHLPYALLDGTRKQRLDKLLAADGEGVSFYLINPQGLFISGAGRLESRLADIAKFPWDVLIVDESTMMRNPAAQITKVLHMMGARCRHRAILSGDPAPSGPLDLFEQMRFVNGGTFMGHSNFWTWQREFFQPDFTGYSYDPKSGSMSAIKKAKDRLAFTMRRRDAGMKEEKIRQKHAVELPPKIRSAYKFSEANWEIGPYETKYAPVVHLWLRRLAGGSPHITGLDSKHKTKALVDLCTGELRKEPIVVTFAFLNELQDAKLALRAAGVKVRTIKGGVSSQERRAIQHDFQGGKFRVLLGQVSALRYGIDLSKSSTMIRYSFTYHPEDWSQTSDRLVSYDKQEPLLYINLMAKDTVDEDVIDAASEKKIASSFFMRRVKANFERRTKRELPALD